jgi:hypothetical protein
MTSLADLLITACMAASSRTLASLLSTLFMRSSLLRTSHSTFCSSVKGIVPADTPEEAGIYGKIRLGREWRTLRRWEGEEWVDRK